MKLLFNGEMKTLINYYGNRYKKTTTRKMVLARCLVIDDNYI
jgi:hypothetical protein